MSVPQLAVCIEMFVLADCEAASCSLLVAIESLAMLPSFYRELRSSGLKQIRLDRMKLHFPLRQRTLHFHFGLLLQQVFEYFLARQGMRYYLLLQHLF